MDAALPLCKYMVSPESNHIFPLGPFPPTMHDCKTACFVPYQGAIIISMHVCSGKEHPVVWGTNPIETTKNERRKEKKAAAPFEIYFK